MKSTKEWLQDSRYSLQQFFRITDPLLRPEFFRSITFFG